jgi:hypothetical protein
VGPQTTAFFHSLFIASRITLRSQKQSTYKNCIFSSAPVSSMPGRTSSFSSHRSIVPQPPVFLMRNILRLFYQLVLYFTHKMTHVSCPSSMSICVNWLTLVNERHRRQSEECGSADKHLMGISQTRKHQSPKLNMPEMLYDD